MLTFKQLVSELPGENVMISSAEVGQMKKRFGDKVLRMGHLQEEAPCLSP